MTAVGTAMPPFPPRRTIPREAVEGYWTAPDGHRIRRFDWHAPAGRNGSQRGSLLFMPGRADAYEKWLESLGDWHRQGWEVSAADWRGQGYSGRLGRDAATGHIDDFATWVADYAALWADWSSGNAGPHVAVAHSMGGHIVLRAVAEGRVRPDALVLSAPMLGLHPAWVPSGLLHRVARLLVRIGDPRRPAWQGNEKPELLPRARSALLTHDEARFADEEFWRRERPAIQMGAASWGWIERALASIRGLEARGVLEGVSVPVLLLAPRYDGLVSYRSMRRAAVRLPDCQLVTFGRDCRHEILRESDPVRDKALSAIDAFLTRAAPAQRA